MRLRALYILNPDAFAMVYGAEEQARIALAAEVLAAPLTAAAAREAVDLLGRAEVIFSGWGGPKLDDAFLDKAPQLRAVFYGAGAMGGMLTPGVWSRGIQVTSAIAANARPVAEYTLATTLFSLKHGWSLSRTTHREQRFPARDAAPGCYGSTVGLISLGAVGRQVIDLLRPFDLDVIVYDPFLTDAEASRLGVKSASLDEVFERSDVVSLHSPDLPETRGMIAERHFAAMRPGASFINTARPAIVRQDELIAVARRRPDLHFVLDVSEPEPPLVGSPLYALANVVLTPHIAGSVGNECLRMGRYMAEEFERFVAGRPLRWAVTPEAAMRSTHRPVAMSSAEEFERHMQARAFASA